MRTDKKRLPVSDDLFDGPSKSQLKRDANKLQDLGVRLAALRPKQLATLDLNEVLLKAIEDYNLLPNSNNALKRHAQFIGKRMRGQDYDALLAAVEELENPRTTARPGTPRKTLGVTAQACEASLRNQVPAKTPSHNLLISILASRDKSCVSLSAIISSLHANQTTRRRSAPARSSLPTLVKVLTSPHHSPNCRPSNKPPT